MKTSIVIIGNSQGVRIPKILLEQSKLSGEVELEVRGDTIVILPSRKPRETWADSFQEADGESDVEIIGSDVQNAFDEEEWEW